MKNEPKMKFIPYNLAEIDKLHEEQPSQDHQSRTNDEDIFQGITPAKSKIRKSVTHKHPSIKKQDKP